MSKSSDVIAGVGLVDRAWKSHWPARMDLAQSATGLARGGNLPWNRIKDLPGTVHDDRRHGATWKYDGTEFWTYDTPELLTRKARYVSARGLGGVMAWSLDSDDAQGTLVAALDAGLRR